MISPQLSELVLQQQQLPTAENRDKIFKLSYYIIEQIAESFFSSKTRVEEAKQVASVAVLQALNRISEARNYESWLKITVVNALQSWREAEKAVVVPKTTRLRTGKKTKRISNEHLITIAANVVQPVDRLIMEEWLNGLTKLQREIIDLYSYDTKMADIARLVGLRRAEVGKILSQLEDSLTWKPWW